MSCCHYGTREAWRECYWRSILGWSERASTRKWEDCASLYRINQMFQYNFTLLIEILWNSLKSLSCWHLPNNILWVYDVATNLDISNFKLTLLAHSPRYTVVVLLRSSLGYICTRIWVGSTSHQRARRIGAFSDRFTRVLIFLYWFWVLNGFDFFVLEVSNSMRSYKPIK